MMLSQVREAVREKWRQMKEAFLKLALILQRA